MGKEEVEFQYEISFEFVDGFVGLPKGVQQVAIAWARGSSAKGTTPPTQVVEGRDSSKPSFEEKSFDIAVVAYQNKKEGKKVAGLSLNLADYVEANHTPIEVSSADGATFRLIVTALVKKGKWQPSGRSTPIKGSTSSGDAADATASAAAETGFLAPAQTQPLDPKGPADVAPLQQSHPPPNFRRGELTQFHVTVEVIEARNLAGKDSSGMSDPMVEVVVRTKAHAKKLHTTTKKQTVNCVWDETLEFDLMLSEDEYRTGSVDVSVFDSNLAKNEMIGAFSFSLADTYMTEHREMHRVWVALGDPTFKMKGVQGYIRLSVRVLADDDLPREHIEDEEEVQGNSDDISSMVLMPPKMKQQTKIFAITIGRCEGLPKMDVVGSCDPFVRAKVGMSSARTKTVKDNQNPTFNQTIVLPIVVPAISDDLEISIWDEDPARNELISCETLSVEQLLEEGSAKTHWINFYCVPFDVDKKFRALMEPTHWCGRMTCKIDISDVSEDAAPPEPHSNFSGPVVDPPSAQYFLHVDVWEAQEMCAQDKLFVQVTFAGKVEKTNAVSPKKSGHGDVAWYQGLPQINALLSKDMTSGPNILVEVFSAGMVSKSRVGYVIVPFGYALSRSEEKWFDLTPDISSPHYKKGTLCGILLMKCSAGLVSSVSIPRAAVEMPKLQEFTLRVFLHGARELPSADKSGFNDPYAVIRVGGQESQSAVLRQTNNPNWNEEILMSLMLPENSKLAPPLQLIVMDKDTFGCDLVGRVVLDVMAYLVADASSIVGVPPPERHLLYLDDANQKSGEIYFSALLVPKALLPKLKQLKFAPRSRACDVEIYLVGMRNLKAKGVARPLNKPWMEVDAGDKSDKSKIFKSKSSNAPSKFNPNYFESIHIRVDVPEELCLVPKLSFTAIDHAMMRDYNIGAAHVSLSCYLPWLTPRQREQVKAGRFDLLAQSLPTALEEQQGSHQLPPHVSVDIAQEDENSNDEEKPLLSGNEATSARKARPERVRNHKPTEVREIEMDDVASDENDMPAAVQDDPILSRSLLKGSMEDFLGHGMYEEVTMFRGKVRGVSQRKLKQKQKASGLQNVVRDLGLACGSVKFAIRVTDTSSGGKSFGELPKVPVANQTLVIRVYVLRGIQLKAMDHGGSSDPYLVLKHGPGLTSSIVDKKSLRKDTLNPEFYSVIEFQANIPGDSLCELCVFDQDLVGSDDLIGTTKIDIENRWLNEKWKAMRKKPLEIRPLFSPASRTPTGRLEFWMDILTQSEAKITPLMRIQPPVPEPYEVRLIIWRAKDVVAKDGVEKPSRQEGDDADSASKSSSCCSCWCCGSAGNTGSSDVFVTAEFEGMNDKMKTDVRFSVDAQVSGDRPRSSSTESMVQVHWGSDDGCASFNWRMKFDLMLPAKNPRLKLVGADDSIGECSLNLAALMRKAYVTKTSASLSERWLPFHHPNFSGIQGEVEVSLEVIPKAEAVLKPNGQGREEPNLHPQLPQPTGRKAAPWDVAGKAAAMWQAHKWKIYMLLILAVVACGVGIWFYFTYGPGALLTGGK